MSESALQRLSRRVWSGRGLRTAPRRRTTDKHDFILATALPLWVGRFDPCAGLSYFDVPLLYPGHTDPTKADDGDSWLVM
jgi:hypothetical protein